MRQASEASRFPRRDNSREIARKRRPLRGSWKGCAARETKVSAVRGGGERGVYSFRSSRSGRGGWGRWRGGWNGYDRGGRRGRGSLAWVDLLRLALRRCRRRERGLCSLDHMPRRSVPRSCAVIVRRRQAKLAKVDDLGTENITSLMKRTLSNLRVVWRRGSRTMFRIAAR
jgi:hypothetical protein